MSLSISQKGLALIKQFEGCRLTAYQDSVGVWTIGYGHTSGVKSGQVITQAQADTYLRSDCATAEKAVNSYDSKYHWSQNQFDALVSFTFNCGSGNLKTLLNSGKRTIVEISSKITAYNKAGGKVLQGLVNRRAAEKTLFDTAVVIKIEDITEDFNPFMEPTETIKSGSNGEGAKWVQWYLWRFGLITKVQIDGTIGAKSLAAIRTAQERLGLIIDGKVGPVTREAFKKVC